MFKMLFDNVAIIVDPQEKMTDEDFPVPVFSHEVPGIGMIAYVGPDSTIVKVGDRVAVGRWTGTTLTNAGQNYFITKESNILAIIE